MKTINLDVNRDLSNAVDEAVTSLLQGEIVVMPTETVYITAVDATNADAVLKLTTYKNRPVGKPFSVAVTDIDMARQYVELNETAINLYKNFLPGPVTVVSKGKGKVAYGIESETGTLGIRIPDYPLVLEVVKKLGKPITATSANASYQRRPYKIADILENISDKQKGLLYLAIDVGELPHREPSTVVDTTLDDMVVLRQGDIVLKDKIEVTTRSEEGTQNLGKELWQKFEQHAGTRAIVFALEGPMGAGKTQFTKGLARAMGIEELIVSPTYSIEEVYKIANSRIHSMNSGQIANCKLELVHIDTWRLQDEKELTDLGFAKKITDKSVIVIEWADKVADLVRKYNEEAVVVWVKLAYGKDEKERLISWGSL